MSEDFKRLSSAELAGALTTLEGELESSPEHDELRTVIQNLRIHQIELEMQNRELRQAHKALEEARDRYADLYDFAPIGYLSLDPAGVIREINLTGARMLGHPRGELLYKPLAAYLERGYSKALFTHLRRAVDSDASTRAQLALRGERGDARWVSVESVRARGGNDGRCLTAMIDETERHRMEQSRRESEARLALIADNVPVLISYVDRDRRYQFNNAAYERWFGHSRDHIHARHMDDVLGEEAYEAIRRHVDAVLSGEAVQFEAEVPYRDAGTRYVAVSYIPHRDADGQVLGFFALINDLSERRRAEQALAEEQSFVSAVLDTAGALVAVIDRRGHIVRFNRECERVTGYRSSEVEGRHFEMLLLPDERAAVRGVFSNVSRGDFPSSYENRWVARDGAARLIAWSNTALTDADGRVTHVVATGIDITERRQMEDELRHREAHLKLVTDAVPMLIAYVDRDMRYRFANAAYREWFGLDPAETIGRRVDELMAENTFDTLRPFAQRALAGEEVFYENIVQHRVRGRRDVSASLVPDRGADGSINGYFSVVVDITDRKRSEETEKRRLLAAAHADRLSTMGEMTTEIAHELNQPLTAIATTADVCIDQYLKLAGDDGVLSEALSEISTQAHRAAQIIRQVRTFARRRQPEFALVALASIVDDALSLVRVEARANGVEMQTEVPANFTVEADAVLVEQVVVNLARNAIEAMKAAETTSPRLTITATENDGMVEVTVADNGPGLSVEAREHLFAPFYTTKAEGVGLGLAICRSIVEAHGGRMWAGSATDGGAELGFRLNAARAEESKTENEE